MPDKLRGLPGLNRLSEEERRKFLLSNADKLKKYEEEPELYDAAAERLYNNQMFKSQFGNDAIKKAKSQGISYEDRNNLLKEKVVNDEWQRRFAPINDKGKRNDNIGLGRDYEKYSQMSTDSKIKLMESEWKPINQIEEERRKSREEIVNPIRKWATKLYDWTIGEAVNEYRKGSNNKVLDRIYNEDAEKKGDDLAPLWNQARFNQDITGHNDTETKEMFKKAVTPGSYAGNIGIPEYAARLDSSEMSDFTIDDMRDILAKKAVYEQNMSPDQAATALNNEAKRYIKDHQSGWKKGLLFGKDLGISVLSYSMDKINGLYNFGLMAADKTPGIFGDKPVVWVDDEGNVMHPSERQIVKKKDGTLGYNGEDGKFHSIHQEQIARTTLHNMGKNFDGSNISGWKGSLDPKYWTRAEQFGTLDEQEQEQYEKLGASPYKVAYDPNEDTDLLYESLKMASFGIADAMSMFVGAGVGTAGRALSVAGKAGKVGKAAGEALQRTGKILSNPAAQGMMGAGGIAYAYQRGAFQETLAKNLANADEAVFNASKQDIDNLYASDKNFKARTDSQIDLRAASIKADMLNSIQQNGGEIPDDATLNAQALSRAREEVLGELTQQRVQERKASPEFARLQQEAINNAGDAAVNTFLPEAIKYGFVNTLGFRKFLYTQPTSLMNKAQKTFKGLEETAIKEGKNTGKKRLTVNSEFGSFKDKAWKFGKVLGSQAWGGVWTNGTDDMMVDAAERVSDDAYSRYLNGYQKGEAIADVYGFADGVQSYFKGLMSSMGQETTWNAAIVGGLGSIVSVSPHLTNLAYLATKKGREDFRKEYGERTVRDENGFIKTDEKGRPITQKLSWLDNPGERLGFFIQNGVLNNYYGAMQNERTLQSHADFVNNLLDKYEDFNSIEDLITASKGYYNANSKGDTKTMQFIRAIESIRDLDDLGSKEDDPTTLSSVIQDHKTLIDRASKIGEEGEDALSQEETDNLLRQYYANNTNIDRTKSNDIDALQQIKKNAQKLQEAIKAYEEAGRDITALENNRGIKLDDGVKHKLMLNRALTRHWEDRIDTMRLELNDNSDIDGEVSSEDLLSVVGGLTGAEAQIKIYDRQTQEVKDLIEAQKIHTAVKEKKLSKLKEQLNNEKDESKKIKIQESVEDAEYDVEASKQQQKLFEDILYSTSEKSKKISEVLAAKKKSGEPIRVLKADEIFALDPISRARMMKKENRHLYTKEQQREIEKLERRLESTQGNTDAAEKIQDIATLIQRIRTNEDAYSKVSNHPEAAARQEESLRREAAVRAYRIINKRNAETAANYLNDAGEKLRRRNVSDEEVGNYVYQVLRTLNSEILDNIDEDGLMPEYQEYLMNAKKWGKTLSDVTSVVQNLNWSPEDKQSTMNNISNIVSAAFDSAGIMTGLEKVLDSDKVDSNEKRKIETLLKTLQQLGYQRDATVIESRKEKKEREGSQTERDEAARQRLQEDEQNAMNKAKAAQQAEEQRKAAQQVQETQQEQIYTVNEEAIKQITLDDFLNITETPPPPEEKRAEIKPEKMQAKMAEYVDATVKYLNGETSAADYLEIMNVDTDIMTKEQVEKAAKEKADRYKSLMKKESKAKTESSPTENRTEETTKQNIEDSVILSETINPNIKEVKVGELEGTVVTSETIEQQAQQQADQAKKDETPVVTSEPLPMAEDINTRGEDNNDFNPAFLSGNAMMEFVKDLFSAVGRFRRLVHRKGSKKHDSMNDFYAWLHATGTKMQNIIDDELPQILEKNRDIPIQFMVSKEGEVLPGTQEDSQGIRIDTHLMLVVEYTPEIKAIHEKYDNGGVFKSRGKDYLLIGVAGAGSFTKSENKSRIKEFQKLWNPYSGEGRIFDERRVFFDKADNKQEQFFVPENISTEIVPGSLIPGYIVHQLEGDKTVEYRPISTFLDKENSHYKERNPHGLTWDTLGWMIIENENHYFSNQEFADKAMGVRDTVSNVGNTFVLVPASNGKKISIAIEPRRYTEIKEGKLKTRINKSLDIIGSPTSTYEQKINAVVDLTHWLYLDAEDNFILISKNNRVSLVRHVKDSQGGIREEMVWSRKLDEESYSLDDFYNAMSKLNPRINLHGMGLENVEDLKAYDEAGALNINAAKLGTVGSNYSVFPVGADGKAKKLEGFKGYKPSGIGTVEGKMSRVFYRGVEYAKIDGKWKFGKTEVDESLAEELDYNFRAKSMSPASESNGWSYYIMQEGEHPEVVKINTKQTYKVEKLSEEESKEFIKKIQEEKKKREREKAAKKELERRKEMEAEGFSNLETQVMYNPDTGEEIIINAETGEVIEIRQKDAKPAEKKDEKPTTSQPEGAPKTWVQTAIQMFNTLISGRQWRGRVKKTIWEKWPDAPKDKKALVKFLQDKGVGEPIGTSDEAVDAWLADINCINS